MQEDGVKLLLKVQTILAKLRKDAFLGDHLYILGLLLDQECSKPCQGVVLDHHVQFRHGP